MIEWSLLLVCLQEGIHVVRKNANSFDEIHAESRPQIAPDVALIPPGPGSSRLNSPPLKDRFE